VILLAQKHMPAGTRYQLPPELDLRHPRNIAMLPHPPTSAARPRRILLVDDEVNQLIVLRSGLAKLPNCEVTVAAGGEQALNLCAQQMFDLLITDYHMPKMDGLALVTAVRQQHPSTQIILLTAFGDEILGQPAAEGLVRLVLEKPIDIKYIRSAALQVLDQAAVPDDPESNPPGRR
jgi:CheY-like chemotaxis protein